MITWCYQRNNDFIRALKVADLSFQPELNYTLNTVKNQNKLVGKVTKKQNYSLHNIWTNLANHWWVSSPGKSLWTILKVRSLLYIKYIKPHKCGKDNTAPIILDNSDLLQRREKFHSLIINIIVISSLFHTINIIL